MRTHNPRKTGSIQEKTPATLILDKAYTRTYLQDDSFIANIRRVLPGEISIDVFENAIATTVTEQEYDFLQNYYERRQGPQGEAYLLRSIPQRLSVELIDQDSSENRFTDEEKRFLLHFYTLVETEGMYILTKSLSETEEIKILRMFNMKNLHISNVEKAMISEILELVEEMPKKNVFFASIHIPPNHRFFCPPNLKHISGMHLTEAARQFAIACHHIYGGVPLQNVTFLLESLASEFYQYARINLPIKMRATLTDVKQNKKQVWRVTEFEIIAYQQNNEISKTTTKATILPLTLYKKLKADQDAIYEIDPRYLPAERFKRNLAIRYIEGNEVQKWICDIVNFSRNGFLAKSEGQEPPFQLSEDSNLEFFMHFDIVGFIHGRCKSIWFKSDEEDNYLVGFSITEMETIDRENLGEAINRFGRLAEEREIY